MKVRDVMTSDVVTARADTTLEEIATMMKAGDTGAIPVVEEGELLGLITDRDIVIRCVAEGHDPSDVTAEDILSENLEVVDPETNVEEALDLMARHQIRRLPVVDNGELVGMVSLGDMAVKRDTKKDTGETLKDVSKGVKQARHAPQPAVAATKPPAHAATPKRINDPARSQARVVSIRPDPDAPTGGHKKAGKREAS